MHVNYPSVIFLQATYIRRTSDVREPSFGHAYSITLTDFTSVNVRRKYIKYSEKFISDKLEAMKCSLPSRSNSFTTPHQEHAAASSAIFRMTHLLVKCMKAVINEQLNHALLKWFKYCVQGG